MRVSRRGLSFQDSADLSQVEPVIRRRAVFVYRLTPPSLGMRGLRDRAPRSLLHDERRRRRADVARGVRHADRERVGAARQPGRQIDPQLLGQIIEQAVGGPDELRPDHVELVESAVEGL